jgi:16S rRNA (cytosine967-C5)-methyltransferase
VTPPARLQAAIEILDQVLDAVRDNGAAADTILSRWFKTRRYAGSKDRAAVRDLVYRAVRAFGDPPPSGRAAFASFSDLHPLFDGSTHGPQPLDNEASVALSPMPHWLASSIPAEEHAALLGRAAFDVRVNTLRTSRDDVLPLLTGAQPIPGVPDGLRLPANIPLANRPELAGLVEVQDAGSQIVALACAARPGQIVIDLCAGAGGKTLALAAAMEGKGALHACDTDRGRLSRLTPRAHVAGAVNVRTHLLNPKRELEALGDLVEAADCVLVDAPCSGTGTWRRNPELRWRLSPARLEAVIALQAHVLDLAAKLVRSGGTLVYAVCSLLESEGPSQIDAFLAGHPGWCALPLDAGLGRPSGQGVRLSPATDGTDGFFFARLAKD